MFAEILSPDGAAMIHSLDGHRRAELVSNLGAVRSRIAEACAAAGRSPREVTLIAVTKNFPASDVAILTSIGVGDIGENRDQEARRKVAEVAGSVPGVQVRWHFVGRVQTNKCRSIARYAAEVHAVDRPEVVDALADGVSTAGREPVGAFVQVSLDEDPARGGVAAAGVVPLADRITERPQLILRGVMAIPPLGADPSAAFAKLAQISADLVQYHPHATAISAGMSADLEAAIMHGSTHVRVGTALLGPRRDNLR